MRLQQATMTRPWTLKRFTEHFITAIIVYSITTLWRIPSIIPQDGGTSITLPQEPVGHSSRPTTFLLGIFCQLNDTKHRQMTRSTMLGPDLPDHVRSRICSLQDYLDASKATSHCQIIYTFVVGGNSSAPMAYPQDPTQLVVRNSTLSSLEPDVLLMNIKENMNDGKTPSWFHYTSTLLHRGIDYVSKLDLDTLVSVPQLLDVVNNELPPRRWRRTAPPRVFGGLMMDFEACGGKFWKARCDPAKGKVYMSGQFYFVSYDIVKYQSRWRTNTTFKERRYEDLNFGIRIWAYPHPIKVIAFNPNMFWWHGLKDESLWMDGYNTLKRSGWNFNETFFVNSIFKDPLKIQ